MNKKWIFLSGFALALGFVFILSMGSPEIKKEIATKGLPSIRTAPEYINAQWANNKLWYDGNAEVNIYDAQMNIYGKTRSFEYTYVFVKEDFTPEYRVKTDDYSESDLYPVMKCNQFARVPTDNYPYHFLTSVFVRWENPEQVDKITTASQEWCGNTFKEFLETSKGFDFTYHSYWDNQGDGKMSIEKAWFEDQLPYTLRALDFKDGLSFSQQLYSTEKHSKARKPKAQKAQFSVSDDGQEWKVTVDTPSGSSEYWFGKAYPNKLIKQRTWWGLNLDLKKSARYPYWSYTPSEMR